MVRHKTDGDDFADDRWQTRRTRTPSFSRGERGQPQQTAVDTVRYVFIDDNAADEQSQAYWERTQMQSEEITRLRAENTTLQRERDELRQLLTQIKQAHNAAASEAVAPRHEDAVGTLSVDAFAQNNKLSYRTALRYLLGQCRSACVQRPDGSAAYSDAREPGSKLPHYRVYPDAQVIYSKKGERT